MSLKEILLEYVEVNERVNSFPVLYHNAKEEKFQIGERIRQQNVIPVEDLDALQNAKIKINELEESNKVDEKRLKELEKEITHYFKDHKIEDRTLTTLIGDFEYQFYLDMHSDEPSYQKYPKRETHH